ncbi:hypothetical protein [Nonomuraea sp. NPDC050643]|uniref:hypothetical protein n=1 Tax=Nonomuraea sp. NPDC050643 TaxID=3155660 RepID=UPI0033CFD39B
MLDEDLHTARRRARRWDELNERRTAMARLVGEARRELETAAVWDQESVSVEEARLGAYTVVLAAVERELAEVGPAKELYEELLVREERRVADSADPRGAELLEIGRLLAELDVELPARERARAAGLQILRDPDDREAAAELVRQAQALGMTVEPGVLPDGVETRKDDIGGMVKLLDERSQELGRLRDDLRSRREELLLG